MFQSSNTLTFLSDFLIIAQFFIGFYFLIKSADFLVEVSLAFAKHFGLSRSFVGFTIISVGTSLPEWIVSIMAVFSEQSKEVTSNFILGNVLGSNIANIALILGVSLCLSPIVFSRDFFKRDILWGVFLVIFFQITVFFLGSYFISPQDFAQKGFFSWLLNDSYRWAFLPRWLAMVFLFLFFIYFFQLFFQRMAKDDLGQQIEKAEELEKKQNNVFMFSLKIVFSLLGIYFGGAWVVKGATFIAQDLLKIEERIVSVSVVALGTSLPELATCVIMAKRKEQELLLANIMGSNVFNIFFIAPCVSLIQPLLVKNNQFFGSLFFDYLFFSVITFTLFFAVFFTRQQKKIGLKTGISLLSLYFFFILYLIYTA